MTNATALLRTLLQTKLSATSSRAKLHKLASIASTWTTDDEGLAHQALLVHLESEYAIAELDAIESLCDEMIHQPPSYTESRTGERGHRAIELAVMLERARESLARLCAVVLELKTECVELPAMRLGEAVQRVKDAEREIEGDRSVENGEGIGLGESEVSSG